MASKASARLYKQLRSNTDSNVELDIETGEVLFEWQSLDHVDPKSEILGPTCGRMPKLIKSSQKARSRSILALGFPAPVGTRLTRGTISTSTASTRTTRATISSRRETSPPSSKSTAQPAISSGSSAGTRAAPTLRWPARTSLPFSTTRGSAAALRTARRSAFLSSTMARTRRPSTRRIPRRAPASTS